MTQPGVKQRTIRLGHRLQRRFGVRYVVVLVLVAALAGCATPSQDQEERAAVNTRPERFTIVPDDYHVPYAGTAMDGRKFFLSDELFVPGRSGAAYVGLFLWKPDGSFDEVRIDEVPRVDGLPPGQSGASDAAGLVASRLAELGDYVLEPIEVAPFTQQVKGVTFGWKVDQYEDGTFFIGIEPGDFIVYYEPWDGVEYDT